MDGEFFHGVEVNDVASKLVVISQVNASTIALVGVSPEGPTGMTRVASDVDAAQFGPEVEDGRTIPQSLAILLAQGASNIIVINCFKNAHLQAVPAESISVGSDFTAFITNVPVSVATFKITKPGIDAAPATELQRNVDYTYTPGDQVIKIINRATYPSGTQLKAQYSYFKSTNVVAADIIGSDVAGVRTGTFLLAAAYSRFKLTPKIIIAPKHVETTTVCDALLLQADDLRARVLVDAPENTTRDQVIAFRGAGSTYASFNTDNKRVVPCYPYLIKTDKFNYYGAGESFPLSVWLAGVWSTSIAKNGIQRSPSNQRMVGIYASTKEITCGIGVKNSDANLLNAQGIVTINTGYGAGVRTWGNRNAKFPYSADIDTFLGVSMVQDVIAESVQQAAIEFQDLDLTLSWIDSVISSVNIFLNTLVSDQVIIDGEASYNPAKNTPEQLAQGKIVIDMRYLPPTSAEHIVFESFIDITMFNNFNNQQ